MVKVPDPVTCAACGSERLQYVERVTATRRVSHWERGTLMIDGDADVDLDGASEEHIECADCYRPYDLPSPGSVDFR